MALYEVESVPHFVGRSPDEIDDARLEVLEAFSTFVRFVVTSQGSLDLRIEAVGPAEGDGLRVLYEIPNHSEDVDEFLRTGRRFLRLKRVEPSNRQSFEGLATIALKRRVHLVAVGTLSKATHSRLDILPTDAPRFTNFDPQVMGQSSMTQVLMAPLTQMAGALVADKMTPQVAYLVPLSHVIPVQESAASRWRNTMTALVRSSGSLHLRCTRHTYSDADTSYALSCLQYYLGTNSDKLSAEEIDAATAILRTVFSKQPIYNLRASFESDSVGLPLAFQRDMGTEAFEQAPTEMDRRLKVWRIDTLPSPWRTESAPYAARQPSGHHSRETHAPDHSTTHPASRYQEFYLLDEVVNLLMPPYTFRDALPGIRHHVPKPFQEPATDSRIGDDALFMGRLDTGNRVQLPVRDLTRHVFVTGASGAGKSNTMKHVVAQLHKRHVPVLIVDPVKRDFEGLAQSLEPSIPIYDFRTRWLRFNPFVPPPSVTVYAHSVVLAKALAMLFPTNAIAYELLLGMIRHTYWTMLSHDRDPASPLTTEFFMQKVGRDLRNHAAYIPTFDDFLRIGMDGLRGSSGAAPSAWTLDAIEHFERRWDNLRRSAFYLMLTPKNPHRTIDHLYAGSALVEFGAWFDEHEVNAAFALIFSMMFEQRLDDYEVAATTGVPPTLKVALLDEAHRIVPADAGGGDAKLVSSSGEAAKLLSQMIAECRALGQGLIISEQSASKVDPNVLINSATKVVHTVLYGLDKSYLAESLSLSEAERDFLGYLPVGEALIFTPHAYQPLYTAVPMSNSVV